MRTELLLARTFSVTWTICILLNLIWKGFLHTGYSCPMGYTDVVPVSRYVIKHAYLHFGAESCSWGRNIQTLFWSWQTPSGSNPVVIIKWFGWKMLRSEHLGLKSYICLYTVYTQDIFIATNILFFFVFWDNDSPSRAILGSSYSIFV